MRALSLKHPARRWRVIWPATLAGFVAGCGGIDFCRDGRLRFSVGFDLSEPIRAAILGLDEHAWVPALTQDGEPRDDGSWEGARQRHVVLHERVAVRPIASTSTWEPRTCCTARRQAPQPQHPGTHR